MDATELRSLTRHESTMRLLLRTDSSLAAPGVRRQECQQGLALNLDRLAILIGHSLKELDAHHGVTSSSRNRHAPAMKPSTSTTPRRENSVPHLPSPVIRDRSWWERKALS